MKIINITDEAIIFDNGYDMTFDHSQDCYEQNYADFSQIDDIAKDYNFNENLKFEPIEGSGFRFGNDNQMVFVPCYSEQNGYYSSDIDIYYNDKHVLYLEACEEILS
jgi:hypothetical protein